MQLVLANRHLDMGAMSSLGSKQSIPRPGRHRSIVVIGTMQPMQLIVSRRDKPPVGPGQLKIQAS
jgi:hypothetical protein